MAHIVITEGNKTVEDIECDSYALLADIEMEDDKAGIMCAYHGSDDMRKSLSIILALDEMKKKIIAENPMLAIAYFAQDEFIESREEIDLTGLSAVKKLFEKQNENEEDE